MAIKRIAVIGGGASGLTAAIFAARNGAKVTVFERNDRVGKKILATGNGLCNITNMICSEKNYSGANSSFVNFPLQSFSSVKTREYFEELGILTIEEEQGRVYPTSGQASAVLDILRYEIERLNVNLIAETGIKSVEKRGDVFIIKLDTRQFEFDSCIVASGGLAAPNLGGTESGLAILRRLGHNSIEPYPCLVPLKSSFSFCKQVKGVKVQCNADLMIDNTKFLSETGEILFTEYGLSGIPILQLSIPSGKAIKEQKSVKIIMDLFSSRTKDQLKEHIKRRFLKWENFPIEQALVGLVHKRLIPIICRNVGIDNLRALSSTVSESVCEKIASLLKQWEFPITGTLGWSEAQVMGGGIATKDFDPKTMESHIVKGLYACGEVLDITGDCGGFNLQWAWSSGYVAGTSSAGGTC